MQPTPSEVFHYTDSGGHHDAANLSKSCTIFQAAKKDLLGIIQLQVRGNEHQHMYMLIVAHCLGEF